MLETSPPALKSSPNDEIWPNLGAPAWKGLELKVAFIDLEK